MKKPDKINILGTDYKINYFNNPASVDKDLKTILWGQIDYWKREIRIYDNERSIVDIMKVLIHEVLHCINDELHLKAFDEGKDSGDRSEIEVDNELDIFATVLVDTLIRNNWLKIEDG
jgi:hypothetical protein